MSELEQFWQHLFGEQAGYVAFFSATRNGKRLEDPKEKFLAYPAATGFASAWIKDQERAGRESYFCAHLLTDKQRRKERAAAVTCLWCESDGGEILPADVPHPTARVESSPGKYHNYLRLTRPITPARAEDLNRRWGYALGADPSGYDLTQLLRIPGTHNHKYPDAPLVRLLSIRDAAYDPDQLDLILPPAPATPRAELSVDDAGDEPPVRLNAWGLVWWQGRRHADDRSGTLFAIAKELAKAGATAPTIAAALAERDVTLGLNKYAGRPDAAVRYDRTARRAVVEALEELAEAEAARRQETIRESLERPAPRGGDCAAIVAELEATIAAQQAHIRELELRIAELQELQSLTMAVVRNPGLKTVATTALAVVNEVASHASRHEDLDGWAPVSRQRLAEASGNSPATVSKHLQVLADEAGVIERDVVRVPTRSVDPQTGEIVAGYQSELRVRLRAPKHQLLRVLADFERDEQPTWGGRRIPRCPDHPESDVIITRTITCAECGEVLEEKETRKSPAERVKAQDVISERGAPVDRTTEEHLALSGEPEGASWNFRPGPDQRAYAVAPLRSNLCVDCGEPCGTALRCSPCAALATVSAQRRLRQSQPTFRWAADDD